jgi:hypothetical protein
LRGRKVFVVLLRTCIIFLITAALLELALRIAPGLIPPFLLADFNPAAREKVAEKLGLPTERSVIYPPRDDGGPPRGLRIFRPLASVAWDIPDRGFVRRVVMDRDGFCNPPAAEREEKIDFLALGDSFTFCTGVRPEDAWPARLASLLGLRGKNLGAPGIGPYEHLQILKQAGLSRSPGLVILNLYEGNDLRDAWSYAVYREAVGQGSPAPARKFIKDRPLGRNSFAYNLIVVGARHIRRGAGALLARGTGTSGGEDEVPDFRYRLRFDSGVAAFNAGNADTDEVRIARELRAGNLSLDCFQEALGSFVALARRHGFIPVVTYTPSAYTAYSDFVEFQDPSLADLLPWFSRTQREFFRGRSREMGFAFLDLTPALQEAGRSLGGRELLYYPGILHLTARGHAVVAEAMAGFLRREAAADGRMPARAAGARSQPRRTTPP